MMMCLGQFVFGMDTLAYQDFQRQTDWRHPTNSRIGAAPARQFVGRGEDSITLQGLLVVDEAKLREISEDTLKAWFATGELGLIYAHLLSLGNLLELLRRQPAPSGLAN